jgi:hypothetical protein
MHSSRTSVRLTVRAWQDFALIGCMTDTVSCPAALNLAGEHFPCDWPTDENGLHEGWAHTNQEAKAVWGDRHPPEEENRHRIRGTSLGM